MGLLDDAIKEHLELKRKHGAGEEELDRQETEALGPARRDFAPGGGATAEPEAPLAEPVAPVPSDDAAGDYQAAAEPAGWLDDESGGAPFEADEEPPAEPAEAPAATPEPLEHAAEAVTPEPPPPVRSQTPTEGFPAVSREDDDEPASDADEDVLEETPEFLQDTPEHDRLWFEQKPPRDFDFDG
jgi:hypothetical protein